MATRIDLSQGMAARLRALRIGYGRLQGQREKEMSQAEFARLCHISPPTWNNAETGDNRIGIDNAMAVARRTGASLDFIFFGQTAGLPKALAVEIEEILGQKPSAKRA